MTEERRLILDLLTRYASPTSRAVAEADDARRAAERPT